MSITRLTIFILGLTAIVVPARASLSYYTSATSFNTDNATDGFTLTTVSFVRLCEPGHGSELHKRLLSPRIRGS